MIACHRPVVRVITTEPLNESSDRVVLRTKALDSDGELLAERAVEGAVAG